MTHVTLCLGLPLFLEGPAPSFGYREHQKMIGNQYSIRDLIHEYLNSGHKAMGLLTLSKRDVPTHSS